MLITALAMIAQPAPPPLPPPLHQGTMEMSCPVGGEKFASVTTLMYSIMGRRPDEKPYSEVPFPRPLAECPGNGLVVFAAFTPAETAKLGKWIATPAYQSMRETEPPFYRAYWLAKKIGRPDADALELLLPAIWSAKEQDRGDPRRPLTARYQRVLIDAVKTLPTSVPIDDRIWLQGQAANALREMGEYAKAEKMRKLAEAELPQTTRPALVTYVQRLKSVIARRDSSDEPLDMIPDVQAAIICKDRSPKAGFDRAYCATPAIAAIFNHGG
jgi:hypothetical protein